MKLVAGIVLAGAVAGVAAVSLPGREAPASPSPPKGPPGHEHVASVNAYGNDLDGPAKEAVGFRGGLPDMEGNLWGARWLRASDNRVLRMGAYEYGTLGFNLEEGPIVGRPVQFVGTTYGWNCGGSAILGSPDAGGENDGIYESLGKKGQLVRLWRNKEKGDRWWFARVAGGGDAAAPKKRGESADALKVKFEWIHQPQVGLDGKLRFLAEHAFYMLEDGKVTCVLAPDDYEQATAAMKGLPLGGYAGGDGSFYLGYYYSSGAAYKGEAAAIWRVAPDGKAEPYAQSHGHSAGDGDALTQGGWFCGPHLHKHRSARFIPADAMLTSAHDEDFIRRIQSRRVATLCTDGEWREFGAGKKRGALTACGMVIGPNGTVYHTYRSWVDVRLWRYTGLDLAKPPAITRSNGGR